MKATQCFGIKGSSALLAVGLGTLLVSGCATSMFERQTESKKDKYSLAATTVATDYEVLGPVEATGSSQVVLGIVTDGAEGYGLLMRAARAKFGDRATSVMFIFSEYHYSGILYPLIGKIQTTYYGTAVKAKSASNVPVVRVIGQQ
ncbi:MAG: hypothetical protein PHR35_04325 [Kiritimatiellae bacterium]|nr:hypothetical protein [Kiritimatiellia bacterium]